MTARSMRAVAVEALMQVERDGYSNLVMKNIFAPDVGARDRAFCSALVYGTLSRLVTLDFLLGKCLKKPLSGLDAEVRAIVRSGLYQLKYMGSVSDYAAVNESVKLASVFRKSSAGPFVNAVLRRALALDIESFLPLENEVMTASVRYSVHPQIAAVLLEQYPDRAQDILAATLLPPKTWVRVNTLLCETARAGQMLEDEGLTVSPGVLPGCLAVSGAVSTGEAFKNGFARVQGLWSQYAAAALGAKPGETVFDMCAAPGGKSLTIAQHMHNNGRLLALDISESRLALVTAASAREGVTIIETRRNDAGAFDSSFGLADRVLCDVPCSNLGMIAYKPELRSRPLADTNSLAELQLKILSESSKYVRSGGRLVYSTCTIDRRENDGVVGRFLAEHDEFHAVKSGVLPADIVFDGDYVGKLPDDRDPAGFFVATLEKM